MTGAYFRGEDYAGFWRRLAVDAVDAVVALAVYAGFALTVVPMLSDDGVVLRRILLVLGVVVWLTYFVLLK